MPNPDRTLLIFLLDRSGSMQSIKPDIEGGFAAFIDEQRNAAGECTATLAQFDRSYEVVFENVPIAEVPPLDLRPRGSTALLDAMGTLITSAREQIENQPESQRPGTVVVAVMTDGHENASQEWTRPAIRSLVEQQTRELGWEFLYMGADQDAVEVGTGLGFKREQSITYGRSKARDVMAESSRKIRRYRAEKTHNPDAMIDGFTGAERADLAED
ncbi:vWA domain-containing protein [Lolliginicoccus suaedae]|uniref:vWA domain-containing protein n=1 Tax=Lolliginicoccus suaedae TaxID=2605429 RepID=UPI0011EE25CB|nr:vWA domain-containing protein [Lolliginicoccus suaedae]